MKESFWTYLIIVLGLFIIVVLVIVQDMTTTAEEDYYLMKEVMEAAMIDSVDYGIYRSTGQIRIIEEKFVENFITNFPSLSQPDEADKSLYFTFSNKPKDVLCFLGDFEQMPFEIATTVFHELRHLYQVEQAELKEPFFEYITKTDLRSLQNSFNSICEPTEIDAIFFQLKTLEEYCRLNNAKNVFAESCKLSIPAFQKQEIEKSIKFISNNSQIDSPESLAKLKSELQSLYNWQKEFVEKPKK